MKHYVFFRKLRKNCCWGGCENRLLNYFSEVDYNNSQITLVTTEDIFSKKFKERNLPVKVVSFPFNVSESFWRNFRAMFKTLKELKANHVVFVQGAFTDFRLSEFLAGFFYTKGNIHSLEVLGAPEPTKRESKVYFGLFKGVGLWWHFDMWQITVRGWLCRTILAVSDEVKDRMVKWYHYPKNRIHTVYNGIDISRFTPDDNVRQQMREEYGIKEHESVIVSTARLMEVKRVDRLINAYDALYPKFKDSWLFLIGDGHERERLEQLAKSKASYKRIRFLGFKENIHDFLKMSDIYVLSSETEGIGTAMLEAMAAQLIVVATKTPGPNEIIKDGINGFLVERSEQGVLDGLESALKLGVDESRQMGLNARNLITEKYVLKPTVINAINILGMAH